MVLYELQLTEARLFCVLVYIPDFLILLFIWQYKGYNLQTILKDEWIEELSNY